MPANTMGLVFHYYPDTSTQATIANIELILSPHCTVHTASYVKITYL